MSVIRRFPCGENQHQGFADLSGDTNPMHMDSVYARRTQPGARVVHGMHMALWALDQAAETYGADAFVSRIRARFSNFAYVPAQAELTVTQRSDGVKLTIANDSATIASITAAFTACAREAELNTQVTPPQMRLHSQNPAELTYEQMASASGACMASGSPDAFIARFPHLSNWIGARRVRGLNT